MNEQLMIMSAAIGAIVTLHLLLLLNHRHRLRDDGLQLPRGLLVVGALGVVPVHLLKFWRKRGHQHVE